MSKGIKIIGTGHDAPSRIVTNEDLCKTIDSSDEWISSRTGMKIRHFSEGESNLDLAYRAATEAISKAGISEQEIGIVIVSTFSGDYFVPSTACLLQARLGLPDDVLCFDLNAACSGFIFGLETVRALLCQSDRKYALLVGSEIISPRLDMTDRGTCILFGDGAGAVVLELSDQNLYSSICCSRGNLSGISCSSAESSDRKIKMDGQAIYKFAVSTVPGLIRGVLEKGGVSADEISHYVCHQANARIIDSITKSLKQPEEKFFRNISDYGNTSAASIPIALSEMNDKGLLQRGQKIVLAGFGAGLTWGAVLLEW